MSTSLDGGHPSQHFFAGSGWTIDQSQRLRRRRLLTEPFLVILRYVDGTVESLCPIYVCGVIMWMRDHDGFYAAFGVDLIMLSPCCSQRNGGEEQTNSMVSSSRRVIISQSTFPASVSSKKHRWPIANFQTQSTTCLPMSYHKS